MARSHETDRLFALIRQLRAEGLVAFRRESQTLWYRIADPRVERLFAVLHREFCGPEEE